MMDMTIGGVKRILTKLNAVIITWLMICVSLSTVLQSQTGELHDIAVKDFNAPLWVRPDEYANISADIKNVGSSSEGNIIVNLLVDGKTMNSTTIDYLPSGAYEPVYFWWNTSDEGIYRVGIWVDPVENETVVDNNLEESDLVVTSGPATGIVGLISDGTELQRFKHVVWNMNLPHEALYENIENKYTENLSLLVNYQVIVYWTDSIMYSNEYDVLEAYIELGGTLLVTGYDSLYGKSRMMDLVRSTTYGIGSSDVNFTVKDGSHPMMDGLYGKYPTGTELTPADPDHNEAEANTSAGAKTIAELSDGNDMIISTDLESGGNITYWNGDGAIDWYNNQDLQNMFKNFLDWHIFGKQDHDLTVNDLKSPGFSLPDHTYYVNATIWNRGEKPDWVIVELVQNDTTGGWTVLATDDTVGYLALKNSYDASFTWTAPSVEEVYTIGIRVQQVGGENITTNNLMTRDCMVATSPVAGKVALISDYYELNSIRYLLDDLDLVYDTYTDNKLYLYTEDICRLFQYQTILFCKGIRFITEDERDALMSYSRNNGSLLITGWDALSPDSKNVDDYLAEVLGVTSEPERYLSDVLIVNESSHPTVNGPYGRFPANCTITGLSKMVSGVQANESMGSITVADLGCKIYDRITSLEEGGKAVLWNGDGHKDWTSDASCEAMLKNYLDWSMFIMEEDHDIWVTNFIAPHRLLPGMNGYINATIRNRGFCDEEDIVVNLTENGVTINYTIIPKLNSTETVDVSFNWSQEEDGNYTIGIEAQPVEFENVTKNNYQSKIIRVYHPIGYLLVDYAHESYAEHTRFLTDLIFKNYWINYTFENITASILSNHDVMITIGAMRYYNDTEIDAIKEFIITGHGLLVVGGEKDVVNNLTEYAWIDWNGPSPFGNRDTSYIREHLITEGIETINYGWPSTSFLVSGDAKGVIYDKRNETIQCAVSEYYCGKIVAVANSFWFHDITIEEYDTKQFGRNVLDWLATPGTIDDHDIALKNLEALDYMEPSIVYFVNATIENVGLQTEENITVNFTVNGVTTDNTTILELVSQESEIVSFEWAPPSNESYIIGVETKPVKWENDTVNNEMTKSVVAFYPKGYILVDNGHSEHNDYSEYYKDLCEQGFWINYTTETITYNLLKDYDTFITINPETPHSSSEISDIKQFVKEGGGLLVVGNFVKDNCDNLTHPYGIDWWSKSPAAGSTTYIADCTITFRANTLYYTGAYSFYSLQRSPRKIVWDNRNNYIQAGTSTHYSGRVVALVSYDWFRAEFLHLGDNRQFGRNVANWLSQMEEEHDFGIDQLEIPNAEETKSKNYYDANNQEDMKIKAKLHNLGVNEEVNFYVNFTVNGEVNQSKLINDPLSADTAVPIEFQWRPPADGNYTVGIEAEQVSGETNLTNNKLEKNVTVFTPKVYVVVDEGHGNDDRHEDFYADIISQGYWVNRTSATLRYSLLSNYDILISSSASSEYTNLEQKDIETFVNNGGGFLAICDDTMIYTELTDYAGITWDGPLSMGGENTTYIDPHPTTENTSVLNPSQSTFSLNTEDPAQAIVYDNNHSTMKAAVSQYGSGKIVALAGGRWLDDALLKLNDNKQFSRNIIPWLIAGKLDCDIGITNLQIPRYVEPIKTTQVIAYIINSGSSDETNILVNFTVNGILEDNTTVSELNEGSSIKVEFLWTPGSEDYMNYIIGISAEPKTTETYLTNNNLTTNVTARFVLAEVLFDQTHNTYTINMYEKWMDKLEYLGYIVDSNYEDITLQRLRRYDAFVIPQATLHYERDARNAIEDFVSLGGGLFVIGDDYADIYSRVTGFTGINWSYGGKPGTTTNITFHEITTDVISVYLQSPMAQLQINSSCTMLIKDNENETMFAISEYPGRTACFVDENLFCNDDINQVDNMVLANNIMEWICGVPPQITNVSHDVNRTLTTNDTINVTLVGERRQKASFDVGKKVCGIPMYDDGMHDDGAADDGIYGGNYTVKGGDDSGPEGWTIIGHLDDDLTNSSMDAIPTIVIDTESPDITNVTHDASCTLTTRDTIGVTLMGDNGLNATFNLENLNTTEKLLEEEEIMDEISPGEYYGVYLVEDGDDGTWTVVGYLDDNATPRTSGYATPDITIDTIQPWIDNITHDATETLTTDDVLVVTLVGEAGLTATFDVGIIATEQPMNETETPGTYEGTYIVKDGDDGKHTVKGYLDDGVTSRISKNAEEFVEIDTVQPIINIVIHDAVNKSLTAGDVITIWLESNEIGLTATFDIGTIATGIPMYDDGAHNDGAANDGNYSGNYTVVEAEDDGVWIVTGYLNDGATPPVSMNATENVSIDTYVEGPRNLRVELGGTSLQHINLTWDRSLDDGLGDNDVVNYTIYRVSGWFDKNYIAVGWVDANGSSTYNWSDDGAGDGDPSNYFYYVKALDVNGHTDVSNKVGKFVKNLPSGKQLFSIPLVQSNTDITKVLQTIEGNYDYIQWYDPVDTEDHWKIYDLNKPVGYNDLLAIDHTKALWIAMSSADSLIVTGKVPKRVDIQSYKGWNFVSYASFINRTVADALAGFPYDRVEGYANVTPYYLTVLTDSNMMTAGCGYWIHMTEDCTWTVDNENEPTQSTVDYIVIVDADGIEITDQTVNAGFNITGWAAAYNYTAGYIGNVSVTWTVENRDGANASTNPLAGTNSVFDAGSTAGNATWKADDGAGHNDTVEFTIQTSKGSESSGGETTFRDTAENEKAIEDENTHQTNGCESSFMESAERVAKIVEMRCSSILKNYPYILI